MASWIAAIRIAAAQPSPSDPVIAQAELDARLARELAAESPPAADAFARGNRLREANDDDGAADAYAEAARLAPRSSHPLRRLCGVETARKHRDLALARCREALALADLPMNRAALAMALLAGESSADASLALTNAQLAFDGDRSDVYIAYVYCEAALRAQDLQALDRGVARLRAIAPGAPPTHVYAALSSASKGDWSAADDEIAAARAAGLPAADADRLQAMLRQAEPPVHRYARQLPALGGAWAAMLLVLAGGGYLLSRAALRAAARLPVERTGRARGTDAALRGAYKSLLWIACAFYYLSIPLVLAVVLGGAIGVFYLFLAIGQVPIKLLAIVGLVAVTTLWAILKSLFVRRRDEDPGKPIEASAHPRLREVLDEVARTVGTRPVDRVFVTPGTEVAVLERGSTLARLRGRSMQRCLVLGIGVLPGMRLLDFKAVLAHEYGHFQNADTAGGGFALAVRRSLLLSAIAMAQSGAATWYNPAWWFVRGFLALFLRISQGASRLQEVLADRWAAFSYGAAAFEGGLRHVIAASVTFDARSDAVLNEVVNQKRGLRNLYTYEPSAPPDPEEIGRAIEEAIAREASPYDSHPSPAERFAMVHRLQGAPRPEDGGALALSLFEDADALQREMTREVCGRVLEQTGIRIRDEEEPARAG